MANQRRNYNVVNNIDRQRLVDAHRDGADYQVLAQQLGIARQTARNIVVRFQQTGTVDLQARGGARNSKIDADMEAYLVRKVEAKPTMTLKEMKEQMEIELPDKPPVSQQAISKHLDGQLITMKDVRPVPMQWNVPERLDERMAFANWLMQDGLDLHKISIDEFGFNVWTSRSKGRAPQGERAVRIVEGQRGKNVTVCLAISPLIGLVHSAIMEGKNRILIYMYIVYHAMCIIQNIYFLFRWHDSG